MTGRRRRRDVAERLAALRDVAEAGAGRLPPAVVGDARGVVERAGQRLRLSGEHTVVALAGSTGSGKSSLFNALVGAEVAHVGVRRPTTDATTAAVFDRSHQDGDGRGDDGVTGSLLDWLEVGRRHRPDGVPGELDGLVLLDLPDHDSVATAHRAEVNRLVRVVDLLVWVVDPQKYADAALHEGYLVPLASHAGVTIVALNHADTLTGAELDACLADLERVLTAEGLGDVAVVASSAVSGHGLDELRLVIAQRVAHRRTAADRIAADVDRVTAAIDAAMGSGGPGEAGASERASLVAALAQAAGVPAVASAVERSHVGQAVAATGWPPLRWLRRLRPDPLRRLHLGADVEGEVAELRRSSLPEASPTQRAQVESAVRAVARAAAGSMSTPWADAVRAASRRHETELPDALDRAVVATDLGVVRRAGAARDPGAHRPARRPRWWALVGNLQWLLLAATGVGALWLAGLAVLGYLQLPPPETPQVRGLPVPTLLLLGGVLLGLVLAALARAAARIGARRRAARAAKRLTAAVAAVAEQLILDPVAAELAAHRRVRDRLAVARAR